MFYRSLDERKVGVVRNDGLGKRRELDTLLAELTDLLHDLLDGALRAVQYRADLHGGGSYDDAHCSNLRWGIGKC